MKAPDGKRVTIPVHGDRTLPIGTIDAIIEESGLTVDQFVALLRGK